METFGGHEDALDYDLMTRTGRSLHEWWNAEEYHALASFIAHLPPDSALYRDMNEDGWSDWYTRVETNLILADIFDAVAQMPRSIAAAHGKRARKPKPYPRPSKQERRYGADPVPIYDFEEWWDENG